MKAKVRKLFTFKKLAILIVLAIVVFFVTRGRANGNGATQMTRVEQGEVVSELVLSGKVEAHNLAQLKFPISDQMQEVLVKEGDIVTKGQLLGRMDTSKLNASSRQAQASWSAAQAAVDNVYDQLKGKEKTETFTERETRTAAEVARDNAYLTYVKAQQDLSDAVFRAPFAGVVSQIGVSTVGGTATLGGVAFEIIDPGSLYFSVLADQTEIGQVKKGDSVKITLDALEEDIAAVVESVGLTPKAGILETLYEIRIELPKNSKLEAVRVGMTGDAGFEVERVSNTLYTDPTYVRSEADKKYVLKGKEKEKVYVEIGIEGEDRVEIKADSLSAGDELYK